MKKEMKYSMKHMIIGAILGFACALIRIAIHGGAKMDFGLRQILGTIIVLPLLGILTAFLLDSFDVFKKPRLFITFLIAVIIPTIFHSLVDEIIGVNRTFSECLSLFTSSLFIHFILVLLLFVVFLLPVLFIFYLFKKRSQISLVLKTILLWISIILILFKDMFQNINIAGPNDNWYIYGDWVLLIGSVIIIFWFLFRRQK